MSIEVKKGDMFVVASGRAFKQFALGHCISEDCVMGKGIAVQFKKRFGGIAELKKQVVEGKCTGTAAFLNKGRLIFYLVTKKTWRDKPTYESLQKSLEDMCSVIVRQGIPGVIMPKIGCGLDRLEWNKVHEIIRKTVSKVGIKVIICTL